MKKKVLNLGLVVGLFITAAFIGGCYSTEASEAEGGTSSMIPLIVFVVLMFAFMYFFMIRPQRKRQKEHQQLMEELKKGDRVVTAGGIYGQIESLSDDSIVMKVESGATMRVARNSIALRREN